MFEFPAEPGQKIIAEGDDGDNFYVIENGVYDVYKVIHVDDIDFCAEYRQKLITVISKLMMKRSKLHHMTIKALLANWL